MTRACLLLPPPPPPPPGTGLLTVVTLISLRPDLVVRAAADVSDGAEEDDVDEEEPVRESEGGRLGARGEPFSKRSAGASSVEGRASSMLNGAGASVLSRETRGSLLPQVVLELR